MTSFLDFTYPLIGGCVFRRSKSSIVLLQYFILDKETQADAGKRSEEDDVDRGVSEMWKFIDKWFPPKLIISLTDDTEAFFANQHLLKSLLFDLVKAVDAYGKYYVMV